MKKIIFFLVILFFVLPFVYSFEFDLKQEINQGETLIATLSGNFLEPVLKENIFFYQEHVRVPFNFDVARIDDKYYISASSLGKAPNNYSIEIKNLKYRKGYEVIEEDFIKNFEILQEWADFSVIPAFVVTEENFYIELQNLNPSTIKVKIDSNIRVENDMELISIETGEIKKINFEIKDSGVSMYEKINLSYENTTYEIPVYLYKISIEPKNKEEKFRFEPLELNFAIPTNSNTTRILYVYNYGNVDLENVSLSLSDSLKQYVSISENKIEDLEIDSSEKINLYFYAEEEMSIQGTLKAETPNRTEFLTILLNVIKDYEPVEEDENESPVDPASIKTCEEMNGSICKENEKCDVEPVLSKDNFCCLGNCEEIKKSSAGRIFGWGILIIAVLFVIWFLKFKYKRAKKEVNLLKIAKAKRK